MTEAREKARELTRDERDVLMHAARRHLRVSGVPLNAEQVATLIELGYACIQALAARAIYGVRIKRPAAPAALKTQGEEA